MNIQKWYDKVFGNNDGKFTPSDLPKQSVLIVGLVVDLVILLAEYRVWSVGLFLTNNPLLALGFVAVSSIPFYLGQLAYLYNKANDWQQGISVFLVCMGLFAGAYFGVADYVLSTNAVLTVANNEIPININSLYYVAIVSTVLLVVSGLLYVLLDDEQTNKRRANRIEGRARIAEQDLEIKNRLLAKLKEVREREEELQTRFGEDYTALQKQFEAIANRKSDKSNPTNGGTR